MKAPIAELRQAMARILAGPGRVRTQGRLALSRLAIAVVVAEVIGEICDLPPEHVREAQELGQLGVDHLDRLNIELELGQRLKLTGAFVGDGWITVGDVVRDVIAQAPARA